MSKRSRDGKLCVRNVEPNFDVQIKQENIDKEKYVKLEPVDDYEIEPKHQQFTKTVILNGGDGSEKTFESAIGLMSQLEIVKSEVVVDEVTVNAFREEMQRMSTDAAFESSKKRKRQRMEQSMTNTKTTEEGSNKKKTKKIVKKKLTTQNNDRKKKIIKKFDGKSKKTESIEPLEIMINGKKMVKCPFCDITETTRDRSELKCHIRLHTGEKPFKCVYCKERFVVYGALRSHIESHHKKKKLNCQLCRRVFYEADELRSHELKCVKRRTYECHLCRFSRNRFPMSSIKEHMRIHHTGEATIECKYCTEMFASRYRLSSHVIKAHPEAMPFKCSKCDSRFPESKKHQKHEQHCLTKRRLECYACGYENRYSLTIDALKMHMRKHTGEKPFQCKLCRKHYPRLEALKANLQNHRETFKLKCSKCHRRFLKNDDKELHELKCKRRRYECHLCGFTRFGISFFSFRKHIVCHTGENQRPCQTFKCKICSRKYDMKHNLAIHMKSHTKEGLVKCQYCEKTFSDVKYKKKHEFQCKKVYECYLCKKTFRSFTDLHGVHMRTHLGTKPYDCGHCSRSIGSVRCYKLHVIDRHLHLYKFRCIPCNGLILNRKILQIHQKSCMKPIRQSIGEIYFKCSLCGKGLARLPELRNHILNNECKNHPNSKLKTKSKH